MTASNPKRKSDTLECEPGGPQAPAATATQLVPKRADDTTSPQIPLKKRTAVTATQKQALIDNLQLEVTERARKLRANYSIHAQTLRTRIEIRVNRIPLSLRRAKMNDLIRKYSANQQDKKGGVVLPDPRDRTPPIPAKDSAFIHHALSKRLTTTRLEGSSDPALGGNKENELSSSFEGPKRKQAKGAPLPGAPRDHSSVLSPTSNNTRVGPLDRTAPAIALSPPLGKSVTARPVPPTKTGSATNLLSNMMEKARSTRAAAAATRRKPITALSCTAVGPSNSKVKRAPAGSSTTDTSRAGVASRNARSISGISATSDSSSSTVVRKPAASKPATTGPAVVKRTVMSTIKQGVTGAAVKKAPATRKTPASTIATSRVLRKRG